LAAAPWTWQPAARTMNLAASSQNHELSSQQPGKAWT
jgi:hypothetical protein